MGLQNQLNDVSSDSIPLLFLALIANCVAHLRSFLFGVFRSIGLSRLVSPADVINDGLLVPMGSGLASLILLADQLNLNRLVSYKYSSCTGGDNRGGGGGGGGSDCVVCLCTLREGEQVRKLDCRHVFHKDCFDGWLDHLNFNCPLCRSPLVSDESVDVTRRRVGEDLIEWFALR